MNSIENYLSYLKDFNSIIMEQKYTAIFPKAQVEQISKLIQELKGV